MVLSYNNVYIDIILIIYCRSSLINPVTVV